jgi:hypothetical protein
MRLSFALSLAMGLAVAGAGRGAEDTAAGKEGLDFFEKKIRPVLVERCYECHSSGAKKLEGSLRLDTRETARKGGDLGPAIVPGEPDKSLLIQAIRYTDENLQMPPKEKGRLPAEVVADFEAWVKRGAPDPRDGTAPPANAVDIAAARQRWPYTPMVEPAIPAVKDTSWPRSPIDHFILAKLEEKGLAPAPDAEERTLLRRVTYDLVGLPPSLEELEAFLDHSHTLTPSHAGDASESVRVREYESAYRATIERLLASPHYGERWGRHWLDVVRYADTAGDNSDYPIPQMYRYRNWVIEAINADMPYDRFIREQLAGDLLSADSTEADSTEARYRQIIATGYIANARRFGSRVDDYPQHLTIEDTIDNLGRAFLGHTLNCARCHNHKFDPITTEDYYALYGIFHSTRYPWPGIELEKRQRDFVPLADGEVVAAALAERKKIDDALVAEVKAAEEAKKAADGAVKEAQAKLDELKKARGDDGESVDSNEAKAAQAVLEEAKKLAAERDKELKATKKRREGAEQSPLPFEWAYAVAEGKKIENCQVQLKGDPARLGSMVERRFPLVLGGQALPSEEKGSGRLELADWIASPANPLTARVMVNRIWQHHFGRGLVATPNDFGRQGQPPSHPELLDWLALRFIESGWSLKAMHRMILGSRTYQMSSGGVQSSKFKVQSSDGESTLNLEPGTLNSMTVDPSNTLLWHFPRRRLDAESIRDTLLVLGGNLDRTPGGAHPFPPQKDWDFTQHKPFKAVYDTNRRSVYLMTQRIVRHPFLAIFDGPDTGASTASRVTSTTPLQALYLLNEEFVHEQASRLAERLRALKDGAAKASDAERIDLAYTLLFARPASEDERKLGAEYLAKVDAKLGDGGWESYVRVLLRTSELVYVE